MKRTLYSLVVLLGLLITPIAGVAAQPTASDQTYISEITGEEIDIGSSGQISWIAENFDYRETPSFQEEYIWFTYGWSNFQLVLIDGPNVAQTYHNTTLGNMEEFYDSWNLIDEEITVERSWFLGDAEVGGQELIVYYEFELDAYGDVDMAFLQFTDVSTFQRDLEFVQSEVTIGGTALLPNTDAAELAALTGEGSGTPDSSPDADQDTETGRTSRTSRTSTDTPDEDDEDATASDRSRTSRGGSDATTEDDAEDDESTTSRTSRGGSDATTEDDAEDDESTTSRTSRGGTDATTEDDAEEDDESTTSRSSRGGTDATTGDDNTSETDGGDGDRQSRSGRLITSLTGTDAETDEDDGSTPVSGGEWDDMGLLSDSEWESVSYGTTVSWDTASWEFPHDYPYAIVINDDPPYDMLTIQTTDGFGYAYITIDLAYDATPRGLIDYWTSEDYSDQISNGVYVLETGTTANTATVVYETSDSLDRPLVVVLEATILDDGGIIFHQISAAPDTIHLVYEQYVNGVQIDGIPLEMTFTVEDIREISRN